MGILIREFWGENWVNFCLTLRGALHDVFAARIYVVTMTSFSSRRRKWRHRYYINPRREDTMWRAPQEESKSTLVRSSLNETSAAGQAYMHAGLTLILSWTMDDLKKITSHFWEVDIQTLWSARLHFSYESFIVFKDVSKSPADHKNPKLKTFV